MDAATWLLSHDDPAVRAKALVELGGRRHDDKDVEAARRESAERGSIARVLDGLAIAERDSRALYRPKYGAAFHRVVALAQMGATIEEPRAAAALDACLDAFPTDDEVCLNGNLARAAILMGRGEDVRVGPMLDWLVGEQKSDGGWHCFESKAGTIDAWEALGAFAALPRANRPRVVVERGVEFLLEQRLGMDDASEPWRRIHWPRHYYYDALVGLGLLAELGGLDDARAQPALAWLRSKRGADGTWRLDAHHPDLAPGADYELSQPATPLVVEALGAPSAWATLEAMRVLTRVT